MSQCTEKTKAGAPCGLQAGHAGWHRAGQAQPAGLPLVTETLLRVPVPDDVMEWLRGIAAQSDRSPEMQVRDLLRRLAAKRDPAAG